ncbi:MAG: Gfo/Idh/MocA family oxidoreductase [Candidatus Binataceae bacterium]|nr:Gfo/Idh/MocA family oxidoreductase [Candidatus Binataceae bacterium]
MKLRLGFVGCGWIGCKRLEALHRSNNAFIQVIAEPDPVAKALAAEIVPAAQLVDSLEQTFECALDGIVLSTPSAFHADQCCRILSNGVAVFCQKPVARTAEETRTIVEGAKSADRLLDTDFSYRFTTAMRNIRELVQTGILGEIYSIDAAFHNSYGPDKQWYYDRNLSGGGCCIDLGIHLIDLALWLLGFPKAMFRHARMFASGRPLRNVDSRTVEDYAMICFDAGNSQVNVACSWNQPTGGDALISVIVRGTLGAAELRNINGSFYDFEAVHYFKHERRILAQPPDEWGGRALLSWVSRLSLGNCFDQSVYRLIRVSEIVDAAYLHVANQ